jgi:ABC-type phosphate/phosphonate transport system ATPase subunit
MRRQIARHAVRDAKRQSWGSRVRAAIARALYKLKSILRV